MKALSSAISITLITLMLGMSAPAVASTSEAKLAFNPLTNVPVAGWVCSETGLAFSADQISISDTYSWGSNTDMLPIKEIDSVNQQLGLQIVSTAAEDDQLILLNNMGEWIIEPVTVAMSVAGLK